MLYELTLVTAFDEAKQKPFVDKIKKLLSESNGEVLKLDEWGRRDLAYKIRHIREGYYYHLTVELEADKANAVSRYLVNDAEVLRHLIIAIKSKQQSAEVKEEKEKKTETKVKKETKAKPVTKKSAKGSKK